MQEETQKSSLLDRWYRYLFRSDKLGSRLRRVLVAVVLLVMVLITAIVVAFTTITASLLINIGIAIGALIVATVVAIWITRNITGPLTELAHSAAQVAAGKLDLQADTSRPDEIGALARAFNAMTSRLRHSIEALEDRVIYPEDEVYYSKNLARIKAVGIEIIGGCCGTTPDYISAIKARM